jgi:hypothetical protein
MFVAVIYAYSGRLLVVVKCGESCKRTTENWKTGKLEKSTSLFGEKNPNRLQGGTKYSVLRCTSPLELSSERVMRFY